jgi:hypothetical protein
MRLAGSREDGTKVGLTTGWVAAYSDEYAAPGADPAYLNRLAALGEGRVLTEPRAAFDHTLEARGQRRDLWPTLLAVAACLLPMDVAVRRLALTRRDWTRLRAWLAARLPQRRKKRLEETSKPSPVQRLFEAKSRVAEQQQGPVRPQAPEEEASERRPAPSTKTQGASPPKTEAPTETSAQPDGETLAHRLLRQKQRRDDGEPESSS